MNSKKIVLSALTIALFATSGLSLAREASEGPRGNDHNGTHVHTGIHKNSAEADIMILARRGADDVVPHPRGEGVNHPNSVDVEVLARRGADDVVPHPRGEGVNHPNSVDVEVLARRGADDPVGSERPGEVHGQKRGGRNMIDTDSFIIAREATEAPRGADNNNQRRRGRG